MILTQTYDVSELGTVSEGSVLIPDGEYQAVIDSVIGKPTKDGSGQYAELSVRITHGEFQGTTFTDRLNLVNQNEVAVRIAFQVLADICRAIGLQTTPQDLSTLSGQPLVIKSKKKKQSDWVDPETGMTKEGKERSEVAKYKPSTGVAPQQAAPAVAPAPAAATPAPVQSNPAQVSAPSNNPFAQ